MGALTVTQTLSWAANLSLEGYTCWALFDTHGRRWGWIVNAPSEGWLAHVGDWGQAADVDMPPVPVGEVLLHHGSLADAKNWVEENIAACWQQHCRSPR